MNSLARTRSTHVSDAVLAAGAAALLVVALLVGLLGAGGGPLAATGSRGTGLVTATPGLTGDVVWVAMAGVMAAYALLLSRVRGLSARAAWTAVLCAHAIVLLGPLLVSQDVFNYVAYARLGVLHHLNPYSHAPIAAPHDPSFAFVGWQRISSAYGPLFTLLSYPTALLAPLAAVWAMKVLTVAASLATVALCARCARRLGRPAAAAIATVGLNPVLLVWAVGGAHNDLFMLVALMAGIAAALAGRGGRAGAAIVAGAAIKLTGAIALPFLLLRPWARTRTLVGATVATLAVSLAALAAFGGHALGFVTVLDHLQASRSQDSLPVQLAALAGSPIGSVQRLALDATLLAVLAYVAWRARREDDWLSGLGWALLAVAVLSPWYLPWYAIWPLPVAAICRDRRLLVAVLAVQGLLAVDLAWPVMS